MKSNCYKTSKEFQHNGNIDVLKNLKLGYTNIYLIKF